MISLEPCFGVLAVPSPAVAHGAAPPSESDKAEPVAWLNYPCITDAEGNFVKHGEPELGFRRLAYGYDVDKAVPLYAAPPSESDKEDAELTQAAKDVLAERRRQVGAEGWTPEHDDMHADGSLALAAACHAVPAPLPFLESGSSLAGAWSMFVSIPRPLLPAGRTHCLSAALMALFALSYTVMTFGRRLTNER